MEGYANGALNSASTFVAMMMELQKEWETLALERGIKDCGSKVIVDDVLVYGRDQEQLLKYFQAVLDILKHYRATINLKKCKWFQDRCEFVGVDVGAKGNIPASSTYSFGAMELAIFVAVQLHAPASRAHPDPAGMAHKECTIVC